MEIYTSIVVLNIPPISFRFSSPFPFSRCHRDVKNHIEPSSVELSQEREKVNSAD